MDDGQFNVFPVLGAILPAPGGWWPARDTAFEENVLLLRRALGLPVTG
ncbi:hypothetical protein [Actinocorallia libanotica]|uniref:Uncharacterized protein n=1 Tax=Actinocorallia libanotica TaxID=46162 RepID=A0ABN1Q8E3_9ACTN